MKIQHVNGKSDKKRVLLYAISTCVWCRKTKRLLNSLGISYDYIDVDLLDETEKEQVKHEVLKWNPKGSYPTVVVDGSSCIVGYDEKEIREVLDNGE